VGFFFDFAGFLFLVFGLWGWRSWFGEFFSLFCDVVETNTMLITFMYSS